MFEKIKKPKEAAALGLAAVAVAGFAGKANARTMEKGAQLAPKAQTAEKVDIKDVYASYKAEAALLKEIRLKKQPAAIFNGALEFPGKTTMYMGPDKYRIPYETSKPGEFNFTLYYPLIVPIGNTIWAGTFNTHHLRRNIGQGSEYIDIGWIPLNKASYKVFKNTGNQATTLLNFHEVYVAHPEGLNVPPNPVYTPVINGENSRLPYPEALMDTEYWLDDQVLSEVTQAGMTPFSQQAAVKAFKTIK